MSRKHADTTAFQELETEAYHAFIEWPLFLVRKIKQLEQHIAAAEENLKEPPSRPANSRSPGIQKEKK